MLTFKQFIHLQESPAFEPDETNLNYKVWIGDTRGAHSPRIKVFVGPQKDDAITVQLNPDSSGDFPRVEKTVDPRYNKMSSKEWDDLQDWMHLNIDTLDKLFKITSGKDVYEIEKINGKEIKKKRTYEELELRLQPLRNPRAKKK